MAADESLARRVRAALAHIPRVEEKTMFGGRAFMVNGKLCIGVDKDRLMFRIDPAVHESVLERNGCRTVVMGGRSYRGYVYVEEARLATQEEFDYWIGLALGYNAEAKPAVRRRRK